jgi:hypothetical protein
LLSKFCTRNGKEGLSREKLEPGNYVSGGIYPGKICDSARSEEGQGTAVRLSDFAANAESAGAIGISSVLVLLDLAIHRL